MDIKKTMNKLYENRHLKIRDSNIQKDFSYSDIDRLSNQVARILIESEVAENNMLKISIQNNLLTAIVALGVIKSGRQFLLQDNLEKIPHKELENKIRVISADFDENKNFIEYIYIDQEKYNVNDEGVYEEYSIDLPTTKYNNYYLRLEKSFELIKHNKIIICEKLLSRNVCVNFILSCLVIGQTSEIIIVNQVEIINEMLREELDICLILNKENWLKLFKNEVFTQVSQKQTSTIIILDDNPQLNLSFKAFDFKKFNCMKIFFGYISHDIGKIITYLEIREEQLGLDNEIFLLPIGYTIEDKTCMVIDEKNKIVPIGVEGKLCIKLNYQINNKVLTQVKDRLVYNTGYDCMTLPDGSFILNNYVKKEKLFRGYIDLKLIEELIKLVEIVEYAQVLGDLDNDSLFAYIVFNTKNDNNIKEVENYLKGYLPIDWIPNEVVELDEIPVNNEILVQKENKEKEAVNNEYLAIENNVTELLKEILNLDSISPYKDLFEIGLNSLRTLQFLGKLNEKLEINLGIYAVFENPTIKSLIKLIYNLPKVKKNSIKKVKEQEYYPLSHIQKNLWVLSNMRSSGIAYNELSVFNIDGKLNVKILNRVMNTLIERHESLRTSFINIDNEIKQKIRLMEEFEFNVKYLSVVEGRDENIQVQEIIDEEKNYYFDLSKDMLIRVKLIKLNDNKHILLLNRHHIISDGWSDAILYNEMLTLYEAYTKEQGNPLIPLKVQYKDFVAWQNELLQGEQLESHKMFWKSLLEGELERLELPTFKVRPKSYSFKGKTQVFEFKDKQTVLLKQLCKMYNTNMFTIMLTISNIMFYKYTRTKDIIVGTTFANRGYSELEKQIGFYVNTLPVRTIINEEADFGTLVSQVAKTLKEINIYQNYPFDYILQDIGVEKSNDTLPLFDVLIEALNFETLQQDSDNKSFTMTTYNWNNQTSIYHLNLMFMESEDQLKLEIRYNSEIFEDNQIEKMFKHIEKLTTQILSNITLSISKYDLIIDEEIKLLECFNSTEIELPINKTIPQLIEESKDRNKVAIRFKDKTITYEELIVRSTKIAKTLVKQGYLEESRIGVMLERSNVFIEAVLGIWKGGYSYVPFGPELPDERVEYIVGNADISSFIISEEVLKKHFDIINTLENLKSILVLIQNELYMLDLNQSNIDKNNYKNYLVSITDYLDNFEIELPELKIGQLAYVLYTSGSTGEPKGAMIEHGGMFNHMYAKIKDLNLSENSIIAQNASQNFDISVWQFFAVLVTGGEVVIYDNDIILNPKRFVEQLTKDKVNILEVVPSYLTVILEELIKQKTTLQNVEYLLVTGEELKPALLSKTLELNPNLKVVNAYGPTEASDDITHYITNEKIETGVVPIGKPINNLKIYVVDDNMNLCPVGIIGEICVTGIGVGRGYINNPLLTEKAFVNNVFDTKSPYKIYKTGDFGRWLLDGTIEFFGRKDSQVKIRGYRIELHEIENALLSYRGISQTVILIQTSAENIKYLCAYIVTSEKIDINELKTYLSRKLPSYMIPSYFMSLEQMPVTINGKVNKAALPKMNVSSLDKENYVVPRNETEKQVEEIWGSVLEESNISIYDNLFNIGGHSISAIKIANRISEVFHIEIPLQNIFSNPTIQQLSAYIDKMMVLEKSTFVNEIKKSPKKEHYRLAPVQLPEWYLHKVDPESTSYNIQIDMLLEGELDEQAFIKAWEYLVDKHEVFRIYFSEVDNIPVQKVKEKVTISLEEIYIDLSGLAEEEAIKEAEFIANEHATIVFDFENGPIFSTRIIRITEDKYLFLFVTHHILWDETSSMNLMQELSEMYNKYKENNEVIFEIGEGDDSITYTDYVEWINQAIESQVFDHQKEYWLNKLKNMPEPLDLPVDFSRPKIQQFEGHTIYDLVPKSLRDEIHIYCKEHQITEFMFIFAVLSLHLYHLTGQKDFVLGSPIVNRNNAKLEKLLGSFASAILLRVNIQDDLVFTDFLEEIKTMSIESYENYIYPSNYVLQELDLRHDFLRTNAFNIMFGLQNDKNELKNSIKFNGLEMSDTSVINVNEDASRFDLNIAYDDIDGQINIYCNYNTMLFKESSVRRVLLQNIDLMKQVIKDSDKTLSNYGLINDEIVAKNILDTNSTEMDFDLSKCMHQLFEKQVEEKPENIAINTNDIDISYRDLNKKANRIANLLIEKAVQTEQKIAVLMEPSIEMIISLLGILKAGCSYVPLNPNQPKERNNCIIKEASIPFILTKKHIDLDGVIGSSEAIVVDSHIVLNECLSELNPGIDVKSNHLAYTIFTSGTTGMPKGIEIEHQGVINLLSWAQVKYNLQDTDATILNTPFTFDVSIYDIFWPLSIGAKVVIADEEDCKNPTTLREIIYKNNISVVQFVPTMLEAFLDVDEDESLRKLSSLKYVICGGDMLTKKLRNKFFAKLNCGLFNHYGPTEVTVDALIFDCSQDFEGENVPIGKPIANTKVYILDKYLKPVPCGVKGEIYIESVGLARGYLNDVEKTNKYFIKNLFKENSVLYKTGDLGKYIDNGDVVCLGRVDNQIKIRGNRVELEEIESKLTTLDGINKCAVIYDKGETEHLIAYMEIDETINTFMNKANKEYRMYTLAQMPNLKIKADQLHLEAWPEFFQADRIMRNNWNKLYTDYPEYQLVLLDEVDEVVAVGNTLPIYWNGKLESVPKGWDEGLIIGLEQNQQSANTLLILAGVVSNKHKGEGLSKLILKMFKELAYGYNLEKMIVPVRPSNKGENPQISFDEWINTRREDNRLKDNWLRVHESVGGKFLKIGRKSQYICATIEKWEEWSGMKFEKTGEYQIKDTFVPVQIQLENGVGIYEEPCVWLEHFYKEDEQYSWKNIDLPSVQNYLRSYLPEYMVPVYYMFINKMPLNQNGKIDKNALRKQYVIQKSTHDYVSPRNEIEKGVSDIWKEVLQVEEISVNNNFFELGGHSLKATIVVSLIEKKFNVKVALKELLLRPTIGLISMYINDLLELNLYQDYQQEVKIESYENSDFEGVIIPNIKPFGDVYYINCFYNSLFPVLTHFNKSYDPILASDMILYDLKEKDGYSFLSAEYLNCKTIEEIVLKSGLNADVQVVSPDIINDVITSLKEGKLVIIWVDCYYEPLRKDTYMKKHLKHSWLIYGYNENEKYFNIVEHKHADSILYEKTTIAYEDMIRCYQGYNLNFNGNGKSETFYAFYNNKNLEIDNVLESFHDNMTRHKESIYKGIAYLKQWESTLEKILLNEEELKNNIDNLLAGLNTILNAKYVELYRIKQLLGEKNEAFSRLNLVIDHWNHIRLVIVKYMYSNYYNSESFSKCIDKFKQLYDLEMQYMDELYQYINNN